MAVFTKIRNGTYPELRKSNPSRNIFLFYLSVLVRCQLLVLWSAIMSYWQNEFNTSCRPLNVKAIRGFRKTETGKVPQKCTPSNRKFITALKKKKIPQGAVRDVIQTVPMRSFPRHGQTGRTDAFSSYDAVFSSTSWRTPKFERFDTVLQPRHKIISSLTLIDGVFICISRFTMQSTYRTQQNLFDLFIHIILSYDYTLWRSQLRNFGYSQVPAKLRPRPVWQ